MICQLPEEKLENIKELCKDISASPRVMVMNIQGHGMCHLLQTRSSFDKSEVKGHPGDGVKALQGDGSLYQEAVALTDWIKEKAMWWINVGIEDCNMSEECPHLGDLEAGNRRHGHRSGVCV